MTLHPRSRPLLCKVLGLAYDEFKALGVGASLNKAHFLGLLAKVTTKHAKQPIVPSALEKLFDVFDVDRYHFSHPQIYI